MKNKIAILTFARFPSEMAYGIHLIQIAKGFLENGFEVNVYYPKTYNSKTIYEEPSLYYGVDNKIKFKEVKNFDITSFKLYGILPKFFQKILYSMNTFVWCFRVKSVLENENYSWSTNPNLIMFLKKYFDTSFYEKHGKARYVQKFSISALKKDPNVKLIGITKKSFEELDSGINPPIYLPLGVDDKLFNKKSEENSPLNIGYVGMLETHSVDKGVLSACKEILKINENIQTKTTIVGGPEKKIDEINQLVNEFNQQNNFEIRSFVPHNKVPEIISKFDIGIVPYPNDEHMNLYASPMKIFELAAAGVPILASNIDGHLELEEFNLGILYFQHDDFEDFRKKLINLLEDRKLRLDLSNKSLKNIKNLTFANRTKLLLESVRSSIG